MWAPWTNEVVSFAAVLTFRKIASPRATAKGKGWKRKIKRWWRKGQREVQVRWQGQRSCEKGRQSLPELWQGWSSQRTVLAQVNQTIECGGPSVERAAVSICSCGHGGGPAQNITSSTIDTFAGVYTYFTNITGAFIDESATSSADREPCDQEALCFESPRSIHR